MGEQPVSGADNGDRFLIGIDPGKVTGVCFLGVRTRKILVLYTLDFWRTFNFFQKEFQTLPKKCQIYIEQPSLVKSLYARHAARLEETKSKVVTRDKIVWDAGANAREGTLLRDGLRNLGYICFDCKPVGRKKWTSEEFNRATGWADRSNQHVRDAAFLVYDKSWSESSQI